MDTTVSELMGCIEAIDREISENPGADAFYRRGRLYWKLGRNGEAISDYERASALDPGSPAVEALKLARDVMDFYNTDLYNP